MKYIGGTNRTNYFTGNMADLRIYGTELTSTAAGTLYSDGPGLERLESEVYTHIVDLTWYSRTGTTIKTLEDETEVKKC